MQRGRLGDRVGSRIRQQRRVALEILFRHQSIALAAHEPELAEKLELLRDREYAERREPEGRREP